MRAIIPLIMTAILAIVVVSLVTNQAAAQPVTPTEPDLVVNDETPKWVSKVFEVEDVLPGASGAAAIKLENIGGNGTLTLQLLNLVDEGGITPEPELPLPDEGQLSQNLDMLIWWDNNNNKAYEPGLGEGLIADDTLDNIEDVVYSLGRLDHLEIKHIGMAWSIDKSVGNWIQGDKCTFDIQFVLH